MTMQMPSFRAAAVTSSVRPNAINDDLFEVESFVENFDVLVAAHGGPAQVRRLVVELAVRGRLTSAQKGDDDVETLVVRIARDVGDRAAKYPALETADEPFSIPARWKWVRWGHLATGTSSGWSPQCESRPRGDNEWGVLKVSAVSWNQFDPNENKALPKGVEPRTEFAARAGDFLMSRANTAELVGRCVIVGEQPERLLLSDKIVRCEFSSHVEKGYVALYNRSSSARAHYVTHASGTSDSMKNISRDVILGMPVPLPPLAEQKRIVTKVGQLMALCDDLEARQNKKREVGARLTKSALEALTTAEGPEEFDAAWKRVVGNFDVLINRSEQVGELRKAIFALACRGSLTERGTGGAVELLASIDARRRALVGRLAAGGNREGERHVAKLRALEGASEPEASLPRGWAWATLLGTCLQLVDCHNKTAPYSSSGVMLVRTSNVRDGRVVLDGVKYVTNETYAHWSRRCPPEPGDVLFTREAPMGEVGLIEPGMRLCMGQRMMLLRVASDLVLPQYLVLAMRAPTFQQRMSKAAVGSTVKHLRVGDVESLFIPLPPTQEQQRIVARVESLMKICDDLEANLRQAEQRASKLVEAVVSELVA